MSDQVGVIWLNEQLLPADDAVLPALDRGLLYGDGVFETIRVYRGEAFRLSAHLDRLAEGAEVLKFALPYPRARLAAALTEALAASGFADAYSRITLTRGNGGAPSDLDCAGPPTTMIQVRPLTPLHPTLYQSGVGACLSPVRRNDTSPLSRIKSLNYLDSLLARSDAVAAGAFEALMLNTRGVLAEATAANLFIAHGGRLSTPPVSDGCLPGIARAVVMEQCPVSERSLTLDDLVSADEAFLTNSLVEVLPLVSVDGRPIGLGVPGPLTAAAADAYRAVVAAECG